MNDIFSAVVVFLIEPFSSFLVFLWIFWETYMVCLDFSQLLSLPLLSGAVMYSMCVGSIKHVMADTSWLTKVLFFSSVSSALNSMAAVALEDYIKPVYKDTTGRELSPVYALWISRALGRLTCVKTLVITGSAAQYSTLHWSDQFGVSEFLEAHLKLPPSTCREITF